MYYDDSNVYSSEVARVSSSFMVMSPSESREPPLCFVSIENIDSSEIKHLHSEAHWSSPPSKTPVVSSPDLENFYTIIPKQFTLQPEVDEDRDDERAPDVEEQALSSKNMDYGTNEEEGYKKGQEDWKHYDDKEGAKKGEERDYYEDEEEEGGEKYQEDEQAVRALYQDDDEEEEEEEKNEKDEDEEKTGEEEREEKRKDEKEKQREKEKGGELDKRKHERKKED